MAISNPHPLQRLPSESGSRPVDATAAIAIRVPVRLIGLVAIAFLVMAFLALASWSVDDPSLSYATGKPPHNWLGAPGATFADLAFQTLGLSAIALLFAPTWWALKLIRRQVPDRLGWRALAWLGTSLLLSGFLSCVPVPATWPLPSGLGGLAGGLFEALAALVTGAAPEGLSAMIYGAMLVPPTLALGLLALRAVPSLDGPAPRRQKVQAEDDDLSGRDNGALAVAIGALAHLIFTLRTAWRRAAARRAAEADEAWARATAPEPDFAPRHADAGQSGRIEPALEPVVRAAQPAYDDADLYPDEVEIDADIAPVASTRSAPAPAPIADSLARQQIEHPSQAAPRVTAPAARPVAGKRLEAEAQGSLLDEDGFELPPLSLLTAPAAGGIAPEHRPEALEAEARRLEGVLEDFGVKGDIINVRPGPVVTLYELEPAPGIKSSRVISLADDIARSMSAISARVAVVPGRNAIGIELPNQTRETVYLREMLASLDFEKNKGKLPICLGKTIGGEPVIADLARMPHLLIAGTTGSGKSVAVNTMILSLLYRMTPEQCRLIMIDPKMLELSIYDGIPHLLTPVVTDPSKAVVALKWAVREMEDRYKKMSKVGVRNIDGFNARVAEAEKKGEVITRTVQTGFDRETGEAIYESEEFDLEALPYIVVIIDEMADLMMVAGKDIEGAVQRLAQMARAAGIHVVMATQRPSVDVITGTIKANFPTRISFQVTSKIDSRTILGEQGAEQLLGMGDMLYMAGGGRIRRLHGPFCSDREVEDVVSHLKLQGAPEYLESITADEDEDGPLPGEEFSGSGDELYDKAVNVVLNDRKASTSYIQRRLAIGYNRAASLIERMEQEGVISPANHAGKREILVGDNADGY